MPAFDVGRYLTTIIMIGVIAGAMMWFYDQLAPTFNTLVAQGIISHIAVQTQTIIYYGIVAYAPVNILFATIGALLVANARAEVNSPLIMTDFSGHILLAATIVCALMVNLLGSAFIDTFIMALGSLAVNPLDTGNLLGTIFDAAHTLCFIAVGVAYLYMILTSVKIQSLQWSV